MYLTFPFDPPPPPCGYFALILFDTMYEEGLVSMWTKRDPLVSNNYEDHSVILYVMVDI